MVKKVSIREYAKDLGVSDNSIRYAIKTGKITKGYDVKNKKIIVEEADKEYGFVLRVKKNNEKLKKSFSSKDLEDIEGVNIEEITIKKDDTIVDIERKHAYIKAQRDLLKLKTEAGELQNKEDTYRELFNFGKEVRLAFQSLPDRIIDQIITMERNKAHKLLAENINDVLLKLTEIKNGN